jgi:hypothetical protein
MASSVGSSVSRSSSASYTTRQSMGGLERTSRRGYVRPQGTNFAKSAQSRESVLSLGSIMHLQYYFARTGLLDGKGGRLAKKREGDKRGTLDLTALDTSFLSPKVMGSDIDSSYASMGSSPELMAQGHGGMMVESPTQDDQFESDDEEGHPHMLPPTVSTYQHREKVIPRPLSLEELKADLKRELGEASKVLSDAKQNHTPTPPLSPANSEDSPRIGRGNPNGWYEIEGMHILDIMTLAIRAAKMYYTAHEQPEKLAKIKSERNIRKELMTVMEVLRKMASRNFANGMRNEEREIMEKWVSGVYDMLNREAVLEEEERKERASWIWLYDDYEGPEGSWVGREVERELAFLRTMDQEPDEIPEYKSVETVLHDEELPTEFLKEMRTGLRLVKLHNTLVKKSKRNFGAIDRWHTDFRKPYRPAENLRYWIKAAELRWEVKLKVDVLAVVTGNDRVALKEFEDAIWKWCAKVREEISVDLRV